MPITGERSLRRSEVEPYSGIAPYYDFLLRHVDYQDWYDYIKSIMQSQVMSPELIVELGCGTGRFGAKFSNDGYTIVGIDRSLEMLMVAKTRTYFNFRVFCADIRAFSLARRADFVFAVHDTLNYQLTRGDLRRVFRSVRHCLKPDGIFLFDITSEFNINENFDGKTKVFEPRGAVIEWSNSYDRRKKLIYSLLTVKRRKEERSEMHLQRIYDIDELTHLLDMEGFEVLHIYGDYTFRSPKRDTIMINFVTRIARR
ncbi:MAG: methyltransferase domain-containing protein [Spirochaetes bacterium]|nr:methyltransferase domain-containing protein [Spirochaetota bacterium]